MTYMATAIICFVVVVACAAYVSFLLYFHVDALRYLRSASATLEKRDHDIVEMNTLNHADIPRITKAKEHIILYIRILGLALPANMMLVGISILNYYHELTTMLAAMATSFAVVAVFNSRRTAKDAHETCHHYDGIIASYELEDEINDPNNMVE